MVLIERGDNLGGRARSWTDTTTGVRVDLGPHILVSQYRNMLRLIEELGTADKVVWQQRPHLRLVDRPEPVVMRLRHLPAPLHFAPCLMNIPQVSWADLFSNRSALWQILRLDEREIPALDQRDAQSHFYDLSNIQPQLAEYLPEAAHAKCCMRGCTGFPWIVFAPHQGLKSGDPIPSAHWINCSWRATGSTPGFQAPWKARPAQAGTAVGQAATGHQ